MVFSSTVFLFLFLPALLVLYYFPGLKNRAWRNSVLLLFSLGFYAWGEPLFVFLMLVSILVNWALALGMASRDALRKPWLYAAIGFDLLLLVVFKYASFLSENFAALTANTGLIVHIALPIGISFFTFQMMSYVFDVYYGSSAAQKNPLRVALYISLFPQLIAGPIVRYRQIEAEITDRRESFDKISRGVQRFIYGLGKKVLLANFLAQIADNVFDYVPEPSVLMAWLGAVAYTLQIYFDFSGYSDMAIGLGQMFGFHFEENFNYPYIARSVTDFWRRWHISLSTWFRDYVYIPLGGNRVSEGRWAWNLFVVWLLTGIWHGANWTFVLWGLIYFAFLLVEKETGLAQKLGRLSPVYTLLVVILAWVFFRSTNVTAGARYVGTMFGLGAKGFCDSGFLEYVRNTWVVLLASLVGALPVVPRLREWLQARRCGWLEQVWLLLLFLISVCEIVSATYNPFIYFNF